MSSKSESDRAALNSVFSTLANKYRNERIANKIKNGHRNVFDFWTHIGYKKENCICEEDCDFLEF